MANDLLKPGTPEHSYLLQRITDARNERAHFAPTWNDYIALACPWKPRINTHNYTAVPEGTEDQFEIFDSTLQDAVQDFASAEHDEMTPEYKPWTKHEVNEEPFGSKVDLENAQKLIGDRVKAIYSKIRESAYSEIASELFTDLAMMNGMISIPMSAPGKPYVVEYVPTAEQLVEPGIYGGVDLRCRERPVRVSNLDRLFPIVNWDHIAPKATRMKTVRRQVITEGCYPDWNNPGPNGEKRWIYFIMQGGQVRLSRELIGDDACPLIPIRTNIAAPTAYSVGPAIKALAPARTLNQLSYDELFRIDKSLRPPLIYDQDRVFDPDGSLEPGRSYARMKGTQIEEMYPQGNAGEAFFKRDELKMEIKRALYVDKPDQRGKTPPTASQYMGEQAEVSRRTVMHRARLQRELVLALVRRFEHIMVKNGELQPMKVDGKVVQVKSISALSRAADLEAAQMTMQTLGFAAGTFGPEAMAGMVDMRATMSRLKERTGDDNIVMLPVQKQGPANAA